MVRLTKGLWERKKESATMSASRHLVDPELIDVLNNWPLRDLSLGNLPQIRSASSELALAEIALRQDYRTDTEVSAREEIIKGDSATHPGIRLCIYTPTAAADRIKRGCYLSIHGGGYIMGNPDQNDWRHCEFAKVQGCVVVAPAYRLAPEAPYPAALNDCLATLKWVHANADTLGLDPARIVIGGESAGGGLAAALALLARDQTDIHLAGQILIYPMLDNRTGTEQDGGAYTGEFIWTREKNRFAWGCYLPNELAEDEIRYAVPASCRNLMDLPASHVFVGALDLFRDESIQYANRLMTAGVNTNLHVYAGAYHAFDLSPLAGVTKRYRATFHGALRELFERGCA